MLELDAELGTPFAAFLNDQKSGGKNAKEENGPLVRSLSPITHPNPRNFSRI